MADYQNHVAFDDTDAGGIVFFGNYFRIAHRALESYLPSIGIPWEEWFSSDKVLVPLRHVESDYLHPLFPGEAYVVRINIAKLGETSVQFHYEIFNSKEKLTTRLKTTHVFIDAGSKQKCSVPLPIREKLKPHLS